MNKKIIEEYAWNKKRDVVYTWLRRIKIQFKTSKIRLLDIGCNNGGQILEYSKIFDYGELVGIDIKVFEEWKHLNHDFLVGDARKLPFKDNSFDVITATEVIEHFIEGEMFLMEAHRVLRNGGFLILTTPNRLRFYILHKNLVSFFRRREVVSGFTSEHPREYTHKELKKLLKNIGFSVECIEFIAFSPYIVPSLTLYKSLDLLSDKIFKKLLKWDMIIVAKKN